MNRAVRGFSLLELLLALAVGLMLVLGVSQVAISARSTQATQQSAMLMQDDARFALGKLIQDIRLAGMFGCLDAGFIENAPQAFERPISWAGAGSSRSLTLVTAGIGEGSGKPDWTVLSDCSGSAQAYSGTPPPAAPGQIRFGIRQVTYTFESGQMKVSTQHPRPRRCWWMACRRSISVLAWRTDRVRHAWCGMSPARSMLH